MVDSLHFPIGRWTCKKSSFYRLPSPRFATSAFIKDLKELIRKEEVTDVIPLCEEAFYIAMHKHTLKCNVWSCDSTLMNTLHNKQLFYEMAHTDLHIPETKIIAEFTDWEQSNAYVFKPIYSRFAVATIIGKSIESDFISEQEKTNWIAQKLVQGKEICVYSIWDQGVLSAYSSYYPRYRAGQGAGIYFEPVTHKKTFDMVKQFGHKIKAHGQLSFDVIIDISGNPHVIECNPRGTSGAHCLQDQLASSFFGKEKMYIPTKKSSAIKYGIAVYKPFIFFRKEIRNSRDVIYSASDIKPFMLQLISILELFYVMVTKRVSFLKATTYDIEWNNDGY
ncbi:ATP-grasp domain-containing protein [Aquimarina addita]|uniref:ATP-grasp domain-containing protein n=1 Tax=Aquimarina addita TaxID=870485 RepID=A0ABP6UPR6_9FLAO